MEIWSEVKRYKAIKKAIAKVEAIMKHLHGAGQVDGHLCSRLHSSLGAFVNIIRMLEPLEALKL